MWCWGKNSHGQLGIGPNDVAHLEGEELKKAVDAMRKGPSRSAKPKRWRPAGAATAAESKEGPGGEARAKEQDEGGKKGSAEEQEKAAAAAAAEITPAGAPGKIPYMQERKPPKKHRAPMPRPCLVAALAHKRVKMLAAGDRHVLAMLAGGGIVFSWGFNRYGQLGLGTHRAVTTPTVSLRQGPRGSSSLWWVLAIVWERPTRSFAYSTRMCTASFAA